MIHRTLPHRTKPLLLPFFTVVSAPPCPLPSRPSPMRNGALSALPSLANGLHGHRPWRGPCEPFPGCANGTCEFALLSSFSMPPAMEAPPHPLSSLVAAPTLSPVDQIQAFILNSMADISLYPFVGVFCLRAP